MNVLMRSTGAILNLMPTAPSEGNSVQKGNWKKFWMTPDRRYIHPHGRDKDTVSRKATGKNFGRDLIEETFTHMEEKTHWREDMKSQSLRATLANYNNVFVGHLNFEFGMQEKMYKSLLP
jgi:hypothetical protein